jgi:peptidoglycan/xylan/chitin deacetylase (PgdA/CDA1 family)
MRNSLTPDQALSPQPLLSEHQAIPIRKIDATNLAVACASDSYGRPIEKAILCILLSILLATCTALTGNEVTGSSQDVRWISDQSEAAGQTRIDRPCNCVIFRMDDVQDSNFNQISVRVMDTFIEKNQSLVVSLVMDKFGSHHPVVEKVAEGYKKKLFEIAGHGWDHVNYAGTGFEQQKTSLSLMNTKIKDMFGVPASTFVPPLAPFDNETLSAMSHLGLRVISSEFEVDRDPFFTADSTNVTDGYGIYHVPATAKFYDYTPDGVKVPLSQILINIDTSISKYGWAVVVMHPQDFGKIIDGKKTNQPNEQDMKDLVSLIDSQVSQNRRIVTFSDLVGLQAPAPVDVNPPRFLEEPQDISVVKQSFPANIQLEVPAVTDLIDPAPAITSNHSSTGFKQGTTIVNWKATDTAGNSLQTTQYVTVADSPDTTAPELSFTYPTKNMQVKSNQTQITVKVKALDPGGSGVKEVEIRSSSSSIFTPATPINPGEGSEWKATILLGTTGEQTIIATAHDYFGNKKFSSVPIVVSDSETRLISTTLTLDRLPIPEFSIGDPASFKISGRLAESDAPDRGIPDQRIELRVSENKSLPAVVTGADGSFVVSAPAPNELSWTVTAHYPGDSQHYQSSDSDDVTYNCFSIVQIHSCSPLG